MQPPVTRAEKHYPPVDVLIDVGHGGIDGGTFYQDIYEKDINLLIGQKLYRRLSQSGYHVVLNRTGDYALSDHNQWLQSRSRHRRDLAQRKKMVEELRPKILISLHVNWSKNPGKQGPYVLYQDDHQSYLLAQILQDTLNRSEGTRNPPVPSRIYYLLNHDLCPSVIVEMGFLSNSQDRENLLNPRYQDKIAEAVESAIDHYFTLLDIT
jgi:N-acetylmuramoyl-L-alanine amidase